MQFSFENCKFRIQRSKEGTGRVVVWMMGVANSYTMEASFGGSTLGGRTDTHFTTQDFEAMGRAFCETLLDFSDEDPSKVFGYFNYLTLLKINIPNFVYFPTFLWFITSKQWNSLMWPIKPPIQILLWWTYLEGLVNISTWQKHICFCRCLKGTKWVRGKMCFLMSLALLFSLKDLI